MEDHNGIGNLKLHILQFGKKDLDSKESLEIRLELERQLRSTTPMELNVFDWKSWWRGPHHITWWTVYPSHSFEKTQILDLVSLYKDFFIP